MKAMDVFFHWAQVRGELLQALDRLDDAQLDFVPGPGLWSVGDTVRHIANAEEGWFRYGVERQYEEWPPAYSAADYPTVAAIKQLLADVHAQTEAYLAPLTWEDLETVIETPWGRKRPLKWIVWHVIDHEIHHRGEVFLMLGLMGVAAPDI